MSPRGVATPDIRDRLIRGAERVLTREGVAALTARAVTKESGCATGVLYIHFADLDELLTEVVLDLTRRALATVAALRERVGTGTVEENLTEVAASLFESHAFVLARLLQARPGVGERVRAAMRAGVAPELGDVDAAIAAYLDAERDLGRISPSADTGAAALMLIGALHHILARCYPGTSAADASQHGELIRRAVSALMAGMAR